MNRVISPPAGELSRLRQPLTAGEQMVFDMFSRTLAPEWEIYLQPHLNGLKPDFVLLHPRVGIAVFEVKDWNLDAIEYFVRGEPPKLWASKDGEQFPPENPITKANHYRRAIFELYCPRLRQKNGFGAITAGAIFPFADTERLRKLFTQFMPEKGTPGARYLTLSGAREIAAGDLAAVFPDAERERSVLMRPELADDLRGWLVEPDFSNTQRRPLEMDADQQHLANTRTETGFRRIKGAAGSGKSLVLAARAAKLADEGKSVLVVTYNITLWHYLRDLVVRAVQTPGACRNIVFTNFHRWRQDTCKQDDWSGGNEDLWATVEPEGPFQAPLSRLEESAPPAQEAQAYDAILVDEGQDFRPDWWDTLRPFLKRGGEMLMVADATQDIYGTAGAWTDDAMKGAGFRGNWARLDVSYRLPPAAVPAMLDFAKRYLPGKETNLPQSPQGSLDLHPCRLRWVQCAPEQAPATCVDELLRLMHFTGTDSHANADITFLTADTASGRAVVETLAEKGIKSVATFAEDEKERRRQKVAFYMGDARIKATTLHSFKGWESPLLVIHTGSARDRESAALVYTGLTRLKSCAVGSRLTIVSSSTDLLDYGRTWPNFVDKTRDESATQGGVIEKTGG